MTKKFSPTILGLTPGSRHLGFSVFQSKELVFYGVKTFKRKDPADSLKSVRAIIKRLIESYRVEYIALDKIVFIQQHRTFVKIVADEIKNYFKELKIPFAEYNPSLIRQTICQNEKPTNQNTALFLAKKYPELVSFANRSRVWQKYYFNYLFGAIAAGLVCTTELNNSRATSTLKKDRKTNIKNKKDDHR